MSDNPKWTKETINKKFKPETCALCGKTLGFVSRDPIIEVFCQNCSGRVPKEWKGKYKAAKGAGNYDEMESLLKPLLDKVSGWSKDKIATTFKPAKCVICSKDLGTFSRSTSIEALCMDCERGMPKNWKNGYKAVLNSLEYSEAERLLVSAKSEVCRKCSQESKWTKEAIEARLKPSNCVCCNKKLGALSRDLNTGALCIDCNGEMPEDWKEDFKSAKHWKAYDDIDQLLKAAVDVHARAVALKPENCALCTNPIGSSRDKTVEALCQSCFGQMSKEWKAEYTAAKKSKSYSEMEQLLKTGKPIVEQKSLEKSRWSKEAIEARFKPANCLLCGKQLGFLNKNPLVGALCFKCFMKAPKRWQKDIDDAAKHDRYDDMDYLLRCAENQDVGYWTMKYLGGHPDYPTLCDVSLRERREGIIVFDPANPKIGQEQVLFTIDWNRITNISTDSESHKKSSSGMAAMGVMAGRTDLAILSSLSSGTNTISYLNIGYKTSVLETSISFQGDSAREMASRFISAMHKYVGDKPPKSESTSIKDDPLEQIKKLSELKMAGILSEAEFEGKKQELLNRI